MKVVYLITDTRQNGLNYERIKLLFSTQAVTNKGILRAAERAIAGWDRPYERDALLDYGYEVTRYSPIGKVAGRKVLVTPKGRL